MNDDSGNRYRYGCLALAALGGLLLLLLLWSCRLQPPFAPPPPPPAPAAAAVAEADAALGAAYSRPSFRHSRPVHPIFPPRLSVIPNPRPSFPTPARHSQAPTVIPAKAGIHPRPIDMPGQTGVLDSGLRRNDGG